MQICTFLNNQIRVVAVAVVACLCKTGDQGIAVPRLLIKCSVFFFCLFVLVTKVVG